ncbi:metallopeptidase family protein [Patescibacteria group bacterium]|nr:MAG: metallopeptidase family protein [Patescibacteria group bacterium]
MTREEFERLAGEAFDLLPEHVIAELDNVAIVIEDESPDGDRLGEYIGVPQVERSDMDVAPLPDKVVLFMEDILDECGDAHEEVREEIRRTLWHEIAHHFGWEDEDIEASEVKKGWREEPEE